MTVEGGESPSGASAISKGRGGGKKSNYNHHQPRILAASVISTEGTSVRKGKRKKSVTWEGSTIGWKKKVP